MILRKNSVALMKPFLQNIMTEFSFLVHSVPYNFIISKYFGLNIFCVLLLTFYMTLMCFILRMPVVYVTSGTVYNFCRRICSEDGLFCPTQLALLNELTHDFLGITEVRCVRSTLHDPIYIITNPVGGIPCATVSPPRRFPRNCPDDPSDDSS